MNILGYLFTLFDAEIVPFSYRVMRISFLWIREKNGKWVIEDEM